MVGYTLLPEAQAEHWSISDLLEGASSNSDHAFMEACLPVLDEWQQKPKLNLLLQPEKHGNLVLKKIINL